ncbi:MAG: hypothetical protein M3297_10160 [Thermoproteota archaeon]|nr:hypothetical protein [Thermoproteota archaeon]
MTGTIFPNKETPFAHKHQDSLARSSGTLADLSEISSLETVVMEGSSTSDDFLTFGDFVSGFHIFFTIFYWDLKFFVLLRLLLA